MSRIIGSKNRVLDHWIGYRLAGNRFCGQRLETRVAQNIELMYLYVKSGS